MDLTDTIAPTSDQLDAVDLLSGPRTFTIERVSKGNAEQPVNIALFGFPRPWRPGKSMRRVLVACWGPDASTYTGRRVTLYCDPEVRFGGQAVGGTRVSHLSHLDKPKSVPLLVSRGKSAIFVVRPLVETAKNRVADLRQEWKTANAERRAAIEAEVAVLSGPDTPDNTIPTPPAAEVPATTTSATNDGTPSPTTVKKLHALLSDCGVVEAARHATLGLLVGRPVASAGDLTKDEAGTVIDTLARCAEGDDPAAALDYYLANVEQAGGE